MDNNQPKIHSITPADKTWSQFFDLYQSAFPEAERRTEMELISTRENSKISINSILINGEFAGLLIYWNFDSFFYVEHFALLFQHRNMGNGTKILSNFANDKTVVLECELPEDELSERRIGFYQKIGFRAFPFAYIQPPYSANKSSLPMLLLTNSLNLHENTFNYIRAKIATSVYQQIK